MLEYSKELQNNILIYQLKGNLDATTAQEMRREFEEILQGSVVNVVFDLFDLSLIDSSGVGAIVSLFKRVRTKGGDVKISRLRFQPKEIFSLLRLDKAFDVCATLEEAAGRFKRK